MKTQLLKSSPKAGSALVRAVWFAAPTLGLFLAACGSSPPPETQAPPEITAPDVPPSLLVPPGHVASSRVYATGVQIYVWTLEAPNSTAGAWVFRAPQAALFNEDGKLIGYHYAGPTWESKSSRSEVEGLVLQRSTPDSNAIPWLLIQATNATGPGFMRTTYIQRVNTTGGLAPTYNGDHDGQRARVPYTAEYYFYYKK